MSRFDCAGVKPGSSSSDCAGAGAAGATVPGLAAGSHAYCTAGRTRPEASIGT